MVAIMALMESPAIIVGLVLITLLTKKKQVSLINQKFYVILFTNGSVLLILGV